MHQVVYFFPAVGLSALKQDDSVLIVLRVLPDPGI